MGQIYYLCKSKNGESILLSQREYDNCRLRFTKSMVNGNKRSTNEEFVVKKQKFRYRYGISLFEAKVSKSKQGFKILVTPKMKLTGINRLSIYSEENIRKRLEQNIEYD